MGHLPVLLEPNIHGLFSMFEPKSKLCLNYSHVVSLNTWETTIYLLIGMWLKLTLATFCHSSVQLWSFFSFIQPMRKTSVLILFNTSHKRAWKHHGANFFSFLHSPKSCQSNSWWKDCVSCKASNHVMSPPPPWPSTHHTVGHACCPEQQSTY